MSTYAKNFEKYSKFINRTMRFDLGMFDLPKEIRILDIGCGFGDDIRQMLREGYQNVSGVEPDAYCVEKCQDLDVRLGSIDDIDYPDSQFDAVIVDNVFHHCSDYGSAIMEIRRVLKPAGLLCFIEPRLSVLRRILDFLTFHTPLFRVLGGPFRLRYEVMSEEVESGLYPKWLESHSFFIEQLKRHFTVVWWKNGMFHFCCKARKN